MKNKYLINVILPTIEMNFDVYIPNNKKVGTIKKKILQTIVELSNENFQTTFEDLKMIDRETGKEYENDICIKDTGIRNGSKIIIM